jgi:hypothetical protein
MRFGRHPGEFVILGNAFRRLTGRGSAVEANGDNILPGLLPWVEPGDSEILCQMAQLNRADLSGVLHKEIVFTGVDPARDHSDYWHEESLN